MVKRWLTPQVWLTRIWLWIFLKIQHVHGQKIIEPPQYDRPGYHLEFFLKIQHVHSEKMTDPPSMTGQDLTWNFF